MNHPPPELVQRLKSFGQEHALAWWNELSGEERRSLLDQLRAINFELVQRLFGQRGATYSLPALERITPLPRSQPPASARGAGEEALRRGEVAVLMVAGGQGTRLGFDRAKGLFPVGPVSNKSLFQVHAEKVLALGRRYGRALPFLVMTSDATHDETAAFFEENRHFGLDPRDVTFFRQGTMPAVDLTTGRLLMEEKGKVFTGPNGHGGILAALRTSGSLDRLKGRGVRHVFYFQVDNPLVKVCDPVFLGQHIAAEAEVSSKVVAKIDPKDRLGNLVLMDGRCTIIEYSDLPAEWGALRDARGELRFWAGSPAIHVFAVDFLDRVTRGEGMLPFHLARKKVPCLNEKGELVQPDTENALKFELFIFDVLPLAQRWAVMETDRREEFEPLKNATGSDSPETVRRAISNLAAGWLESAGVSVPRDAEGNAVAPLEVSPLFALDAEELKGKIDPATRVEGPTYFR